MDQKLLSQVEQSPAEFSDQSLYASLSLITNPYTCPSVLSTVLKILSSALQNPSPTAHDHQKNHLISLLSVTVDNHPFLQDKVLSILRPILFSQSIPTTSVLSVLLKHNLYVADESMFLSLCFCPCTSLARSWMLRNLNKFSVRPSLLITVLSGFTKDPYPLTRKAALDGLSLLGASVVVEDQSIVQGCYFRAVELLFDAEESVRCSAVRTVSIWGQLIVGCNQDKAKSDWSDALFVQLCSMVRDMSMTVRIEAYDALARIESVAEDIVFQTLSKKASLDTRDKYYPGKSTAELFKLPASTAAFALVHGLEDEYYEVRRAACFALSKLTILYANFASEAVSLFINMLNDDSSVVRLEALEAIYQVALSAPWEVQEGHLHTLLGILVDGNSSIRYMARRVVRLTRLKKLAMFRLCIEAFVRNLELYPQDEADLLLALFIIGQKHGKFVVHLVQEVSEEIEPSSGGRFVFESRRAITMLILAVSAPVSFKRCICSVAPRLFSFAVTLLGRISRGLAGIMDKHALLAYLCRCSQFTFAPISEFYEGGGSDLTLVNCDQLSESCRFQPLRMMETKKGVSPFLASSVKMQDEATDYANIILKNMKDLWPLIQCGRNNEFFQQLRTWKRELISLPSDSVRGTANLLFALRYLRIIKLLGRIWMHCVVSILPCSSRVGKLEISLGKLQRVLGEVQQRFSGFSKQEGAHILELVLVSHTLKISFVKASCPCESLKKMHITVSSLEELSKRSMVELSEFVTDVQQVLRGIFPLTDESTESLALLQKSLNCFSLRQFVLSGVLRAPEVELDISNSYENPLRYISGLPAGIPVEIRFRNLLHEHRLWLKMTDGEKLNQFVFLDLDGIGCCDDFQKFSLVTPFHGTPATSCFVLKVSVGMECCTDLVPMSNCNGAGPRGELFYINSDKEVYLTRMTQEKS